MSRAMAIRIAFVCVLAAAGGWPVLASADETTVEFGLFNAGTLTVAWASGEGQFLANGVDPGVSSASPPVVATAQFDVSIADTRADGERPGYTIAVSASTFTAEGSTTPLAPSQLAITSVSSPESLPLQGANSALGSPVTVLTVADEAPAIAATISITVSLTIFAGTMPGDYIGKLMLEVQPLMAID